MKLITIPAQYRSSPAYQPTLDALKHLQANGPDRSCMGICGNVCWRVERTVVEDQCTHYETMRLLYSLFWRWLISNGEYNTTELVLDNGSFSDPLYYPIELDEQRFDIARDYDMLWEPADNHYVQRRQRLLRDCINYLETAP